VISATRREFIVEMAPCNIGPLIRDLPETWQVLTDIVIDVQADFGIEVVENGCMYTRKTDEEAGLKHGEVVTKPTCSLRYLKL